MRTGWHWFGSTEELLYKIRGLQAQVCELPLQMATVPKNLWISNENPIHKRAPKRGLSVSDSDFQPGKMANNNEEQDHLTNVLEWSLERDLTEPVWRGVSDPMMFWECGRKHVDEECPHAWVYQMGEAYKNFLIKFHTKSCERRYPAMGLGEGSFLDWKLVKVLEANCKS